MIHGAPNGTEPALIHLVKWYILSVYLPQSKMVHLFSDATIKVPLGGKIKKKMFSLTVVSENELMLKLTAGINKPVKCVCVCVVVWGKTFPSVVSTSSVTPNKRWIFQ